MRIDELQQIAQSSHFESNMGKQRINLSQKAYNILMMDMNAFYFADRSNLHLEQISSKIINRVIQNFCLDAESTISYDVQKEQERIRINLKELDKDAQLLAVDLLCKAYEQKLIDKASERLKVKGTSCSYSLNKTTIQNLATVLSGDADHYGNRLDKYLKALLEEYTELSYIERESVYFKKELETIYNAINSKKELKLSMVAGDLYIKPVIVQADIGKNYHYLAGFLSQNDSSDEKSWSRKAIRINKIQKIQVWKSFRGIESEKITNLKNLIAKRGIQYLSDGNVQKIFRVQFTKSGIKKYKSMQHMRPMYCKIEKEGDYTILEFNCSEYQLKTYLQRFGKEARVLSPDKLAKEMEKYFYQAYLVYRNVF